MSNNSVLKPALFLFFFFSLLYHAAIANLKPPYTPKDIIRLNCGSSVNITAPDGRQWMGDRDRKFGPVEPSNTKSMAAMALLQGSSVDLVPYMTVRISRSQFMYTFPVSLGPKFVRLYFYPAPYPGFDRSKAFFNVKAGPYTLLRNFSAPLFADAWPYESFFKEFCVNVEENQQLNITFAPFLSDSNDSYVFVNGIEIVSMPTNLYYTPPDGPGVTFIGQKTTFYAQHDTALETICRLNVGGSTISPVMDTGMYRLWNDDSHNFVDLFSDILSVFNMSLNYSKILAYTAPDAVYQSARSTGRNKTDNQLRNLTWIVPVHHGFKYLVRLHFCELDPTVEVYDRPFNIFIDNQTAEVDFDVLKSSGGIGIPIYKDYVVAIVNKGETSDYELFLSLHSNGSGVYDDVILNGLEVFKLSDSNGNLAGPNSVPLSIPSPPDLPSAFKKSHRKNTQLIAVRWSIIVVLLILSLICCVIVWLLKRRKIRGSHNESLTHQHENKLSCRQVPSQLDEQSHHFSLAEFSLYEIIVATNNFDENLIIGVGGFGKVYRGDIDDGAVAVAIKRFSPESRQGAHEFNREIVMQSQLRHIHLVSLIGYCHDEGEWILVYEYMLNGTLREHLYETNNDPLPWKQRLEICIGVARGLHYLHEGEKHTIIHRDVKTSNILLDEDWVVKVSDFGISKVCNNNSVVSTVVKGTWGYLDPEYARRNQLTEKSDVYSFGVVLFEVLCARKPLNRKLPEEQWNLVNWARKCIQNGTIHQIIDPYLMGKIAPKCFNKFVEIAESCVQDQGLERPTMRDVMKWLEFVLELQEAADAAKEGTSRGESVYPEIPFCAPQCTSVAGESEIGSSTSPLNAFDLTTTEPAFSGNESGSIIFGHVCSDSSKH